LKVERTVEVAAPRTTVWQVAHDPSLRPLWDVRVAQLTLHADPAAGSWQTIAWRTPVVHAVAEAQITAFEAPSRSTVRVEEATLPIFPPGEHSWSFEETRKGTRVTFHFVSSPGATQKGPGWLVAILLRRDMKRSLRNLRQLVGEVMDEESVTVSPTLEVAPSSA
jgi:uncharacterized protein YndB with AHSA1/START domain